MSKNITQNKTEFIQFRLDRDSKITAKALAEKYFDGKMSAMFRYMLNNTDLTKMYNTGPRGIVRGRRMPLPNQRT